MVIRGMIQPGFEKGYERINLELERKKTEMNSAAGIVSVFNKLDLSNHE